MCNSAGFLLSRYKTLTSLLTWAPSTPAVAAGARWGLAQVPGRDPSLGSSSRPSRPTRAAPPGWQLLVGTSQARIAEVFLDFPPTHLLQTPRAHRTTFWWTPGLCQVACAQHPAWDQSRLLTDLPEILAMASRDPSLRLRSWIYQGQPAFPIISS